jgi:hypothetical protein
VRLVSGSEITVQALNRLVSRSRGVAAARATAELGTIPAETFDELWAAERNFVHAAREELGLTGRIRISAQESQSA